jgi:hypothetical protein
MPARRNPSGESGEIPTPSTGSPSRLLESGRGMIVAPPQSPQPRSSESPRGRSVSGSTRARGRCRAPSAKVSCSSICRTWNAGSRPGHGRPMSISEEDTPILRHGWLSSMTSTEQVVPSQSFHGGGRSDGSLICPCRSGPALLPPSVQASRGPEDRRRPRVDTARNLWPIGDHLRMVFQGRRSHG